MKKVKIEIVIAYDEKNNEAVEFIETFRNLDIGEGDDFGEDGFAVVSASVNEI